MENAEIPPSGVTRASYDILGTPLTATDYETLIDDVIDSWRNGVPRTLSFCNTFMVAKRRQSPEYRSICQICDTNVPDGMPLVWCMNRQGASMNDRVYGPIFMERFLRRSPAEIRHYLLGGTVDCLRKLCENAKALNPNLQLVGTHDGFFGREQNSQVLTDIQSKSPDIIWVGMGTPKQDEWVAQNRAHFPRAILLPVGSSFEILAGIKRIPSMFFQRLGLTWVFRMCGEPTRLIPRYVRYNSLFLYYLLRDSMLRRFSRWKRRESAP